MVGLGLEEGAWESVFNGDRGSLWGDESVLGTDGGGITRQCE